MKKTIIFLILVSMFFSCMSPEDKLVGKWDSFIVGFGNTPEHFEDKQYPSFSNLTISKGDIGLIVYEGSKLCQNVFFDGDEISFQYHFEYNKYVTYEYYYKLKLNKNGDFLIGECTILDKGDNETSKTITYLIKCKKIN